MAKAFKGRWRISEMEVWDNDYLDLVEPAHIVLERENDVAFVFGTSQGLARRSLRSTRRLGMRRVLLGRFKRHRPRFRPRVGHSRHRREARRAHLHPQQR